MAFCVRLGFLVGTLNTIYLIYNGNLHHLVAVFFMQKNKA